MRAKVLTSRFKWVEYKVSPVRKLEPWVVRQILDSKFGFWGWLWYRKID